MIPHLDWADMASDPERFAARVGAACRDHGFFLLENHSVPPGLIAETFAAADAFFALPDSAKAPYSILNNPHNRGWAAEGTESLDEHSARTDRKQAFNIGLDLAPDDADVLAGAPFRGVNLWPDLPGFRTTCLAYYEAALALGIGLHAAFARDLGLSPGYFAPHFTAPMATLRLLSYPAGTGAEGEIGAGAHTDYGSITLLMTDGVSGLQVRPRGQDWVSVPHIEGAFIVNIADCLMRWTNDTYISTPHRVLPPPRPRRSLAFFLDPNPASLIEGLPGTGQALYPPITAADYLRSRLDATYMKGDRDETP